MSELRTDDMPHAPHIAVDGLIGRTVPLSVDMLVDAATVDPDGCLVLCLLDLMALIRLDADAQIVLVHHEGGSITALSVSEMVTREELVVVLQLRRQLGDDTVEVTPSLRQGNGEFSGPIRGLKAITFSTFVGAP